MSQHASVWHVVVKAKQYRKWLTSLTEDQLFRELVAWCRCNPGVSFDLCWMPPNGWQCFANRQFEDRKTETLYDGVSMSGSVKFRSRRLALIALAVWANSAKGRSEVDI